MISLILFFREDFNKSFSENSLIWEQKLFSFKSGLQIGALIGLGVLGVFKFEPVFRSVREKLPTFSWGEYATVSYTKNTGTKYIKSETDRASGIYSVRLVLCASELEIDRANKDYSPRLAFRGGVKFLGDPPYVSPASDTNSRKPPSRALPKPQRLHNSSVFQSLPKAARRDSLKLNASTLNKSGIRSPIDTSIFRDEWHPVEGRGESVVVEALRPVRDSADYRGYDYENLMATQKIIGKSTILDDTTKSEVAKGAIKRVKQFYDKRDELIQARNNSTNPCTEVMYRDIENIEKTIRIEKKRLEYYKRNVFNSDIVAVIIRRTPAADGHGDTTLNYQMYDPALCSNEQKKITGDDLPQYFRYITERIELGTITPSEIKQCEEIQETTLVSCSDVNVARTKTAETLDVKKERRIRWLPRETQCRRHKWDKVKSEPTNVDIFVLEKLTPKAKFTNPKKPRAKIRRTQKAKFQKTPRAKGLEMPKAKHRNMRGKQ